MGLFLGGRPVIVDDVPHWGLDLVDPDEDFSAAQFKDYAEKKIADILKRGKLPVLVGGTGMWIWSIVDNLSLTETPPDPVLRAELEKRHLDDLFAEYKRLDPDGAEVIDRDNPRRVIRALEVTKKTGKPFSAQMTKGESLYNAIQIGLDVEREELNARIDNRVDEMIAKGFVNEVRALKESYGCDAPGMSAIGYKQICSFLDGKSSLADVIAETKIATRKYAKRQMTWCRRDDRIKWVKGEADAINAVIARRESSTDEAIPL